MTNESKLNILNYMIGNITQNLPNNDEIFLEQESIDFWTWYPFIPHTIKDFKFEGMIGGNEANTNLTVLYGGYRDGDNVSRGIIILVDENFQPVKTIYEYSSGTPLRHIQCMKQADDGTFYFIDDDDFNSQNWRKLPNSQKRFVMTNNFTISTNDDYVVRLRTSYILSDTYKNFYCKNMYKDPNSSHYIFFGSGATENDYIPYILRIFSLKINVGISNEWISYVNSTGYVYGSAIAVFEDENVKFRCLVAPNDLSSRSLKLYSKTYTGSVTTSNVGSFAYLPYIDSLNYKNQSVFLDYDTVYFIQNNQLWGISGTPIAKYIGLYKYNITNNTMLTIYEKSLGNYDYCNIEAIYIEKCNTDLYVQYNNNINTTNNTADYYVNRLVNDTWNPILIAETVGFVCFYRMIYIKNNYNLLQIFLFQTRPYISYWFQYIIKEDYNALNYNGTPYNDYDFLISKKGRLYSNNKLLFARNLYNKTIYNNTTTSTIQIPNTYLNNLSISPKQLLSNTNILINNDTNIFTKNIYENVLLNFINSLNVIDEDTDTVYPNTANYINQNINTGTETNYNNTKIGKVRLNFANGSQIIPISWTDNNGVKETQFSMYVPEEIQTIDFISDDELFIYLTKQFDNLVVGNIYTISQKLRIE